ncbi:MAG TPA: hypothetical protein VIJ25_20135, partial [Methylococcales bacterium]
ILLALLVRQLITTWQRWQKIEQQTFFIAFVYSAIGAAMLIAARTRYEWGQHINTRYALPYTCFIFVALVIVFKHTALKINIRYWGLGLAITLLIARACELPRLYEYDQYYQTVMGVAKQIKTNQDVVCNHLNGRFGVSNWAFVYRILCAAPVRHVWSPFRKNEFVDEKFQRWAELGAEQGIVVSLFFNNKDDIKSGQPLDQDTVVKLKASGWQIERNDQENLILSRKAKSSPF